MPPPLRSGQSRNNTAYIEGSFMLADCGYVVVVDVDPSLRQIVIKYLEDNNVPTKSASNRTEFNRHFAGTPPRLIILDQRLGQDDGLDRLRVKYRHGQ